MKVFGKRNNESLNKVHVKKYTNYPKSVINFPRDSKTFHPTQKPVALFEYLIKTYTKEGETVLDNCIRILLFMADIAKEKNILDTLLNI